MTRSSDQVPLVTESQGESEAPAESTERSPSQSRSRHRRRHRRRNRFRFKRKESNFAAAVCSMAVMVLLCTALVEPQWFFIHGGGCRQLKSSSPLNYLGMNQFFYIGSFLPTAETGAKTLYNYGSEDKDVLVDCVSQGSVEVLRSIIVLSFVGITFSMMAFLLDLSGPATKVLKYMRRNAVFNIMTVAVCVIINGFSYWVVTMLEELQKDTRLHKGSKVEVQFSVSFYLVAAGGAMSVLAASCNLLRRHPFYDPREHRHLVEEYTDIEQALGMDRQQPTAVLLPPPPYAP